MFYVVTLMMALVMVVTLAIVFYPPLVVNAATSKHKHAFNAAAKPTWFLPQYKLMEVVMFILYAFAAVTTILNILFVANPYTEEPEPILFVFFAFVRITLCHVSRGFIIALAADQSPIKALALRIAVVALDVALIVLAGVMMDWVTFGLLFGMAAIDLYLIAAISNWFYTTKPHQPAQPHSNVTVIMGGVPASHMQAGVMYSPVMTAQQQTAQRR